MKISNEIKLKLIQTYTSESSGKRQHFLSDIIKSNDLKLGAEIGVRFGQTMFHILKENENLKMYAIDKDVTQFDQEAIEFQDRIFIHQVDSRKNPEFVEDNTLDFFFIDASHTYKNVKRDLVSWIPKLKENAWMVGHDINYPSVETAVKEIIGEYEVGPDNVWFYKKDKNYKGLIKL
jgi:predicted O-methyltransferase YrrM